MKRNSEFNYVNTFPPLGHTEHHFTKYPNHPWLKTKDEIYTWIDKYQDKYSKNSIVMHKDLTVSSSELRFEVKDLKNIPVQFRDVKKFSVAGNKLTNLIGSPYIVCQIAASNNKLISLLGLSSLMKGDLDVENNKLKSFKGMCDNLESIEVVGNPIESWNGFTNCENFRFWQKEWCEENSYDLLIKTPKNIKLLWCCEDFISTKIVKENDGLISMSWLRDSQKSIHLNKSLNNIFKNEEKNKKRKL